jgi:uncharacterized protein
MRLISRILAAILFVAYVALWSQDQIPERPNPPRLVNEYFTEPHQYLSESEAEQLNTKLGEFAKSTSNQICIVAIDDLKGIEPSQYATWLIQKWGIGQKDKRNGVVVLVKLPSKVDSKRSLFIATGYGLEGAIPDLLAKKIRENEMVPYFKEGNFYQGLDNGTNALMQAAKGEYNEDATVKSMSSQDTVTLVVVIIFFLIIIITGFFSKNKGGGNHGSSGGGFTYWGGGGFSNFGGDSSSDSGGSWDFGGGDSGGGGSGGDW